MAASVSDCEPPADFHLSSSTENSGSRFSSTIEKCFLCINPRKTFYCKHCVQNGDFVHSTGHYSERFAEKQLLLMHWKKEKQYVEEQCEEILLRRMQTNQLQCEINDYQERITYLRMLSEETKRNIELGKHRTATLAELNRQRGDRLPKYEERVSKLENYVIQVKENTGKRRSEVNVIQEELKKVIRASVQQLIQYIFPIEQVHPPPSEEDREAQDTVSALADATRTAYVRGRWVFTDSSGELQHCIVSPCLPGSGDYSAYNMWVAANKDGVPGGGSEAAAHNPAYNISAALTYTTQLVNVLAFYLDVRLPTRLCYSDFCGHEMTDHQFARRVARLNSNVLYLCFSQNVKPDLLHPTHTLQNILHMLDTEVSDLGRQGPVEIDASLAKYLEDQLAKDLESNEDSGSEDESDNLPWEWEAVPHISCPELTLGTCNNMLSQQQSLTSTQQATSMAGGLVISAAASLASIWRGWTGHK